MTSIPEQPVQVEDEAARAGWLYYVAGMTQDEIAREMGLSRQRAQRLVSRAVNDGLVRVRLQHPLSACLELESAMIRRFGLSRCRIAPSLPDGMDQTATIAPLAAAEIERVLRREDPLTIALGTGRTMRAAVEEMVAMDCDQHKIVSLNGTIGADGAGTSYDVIMRISNRVRCHHYPMPVPVLCDSAEERNAFYGLAPVQRVAELARQADEVFVGLGQVSESAPLMLDGFLTAGELAALRAKGAAGEIAGWVFDSQGRYMDHDANDRVGGVRVEPDTEQNRTCFAAGPSKVTALRGALSGRLFNGLVTDEKTARTVLDSPSA
ncbi:MAG: sugar-binding transcriptional regulator [Rhodobacteraceae bacterium]|nr:sugar-binding transcriptional regulator [Paracoccaceae bacterium]